MRTASEGRRCDVTPREPNASQRCRVEWDVGRGHATPFGILGRSFFGSTLVDEVRGWGSTSLRSVVCGEGGVEGSSFVRSAHPHALGSPLASRGLGSTSTSCTAIRDGIPLEGLGWGGWALDPPPVRGWGWGTNPYPSDRSHPSIGA